MITINVTALVATIKLWKCNVFFHFNRIILNQMMPEFLTPFLVTVCVIKHVTNAIHSHKDSVYHGTPFKYAFPNKECLTRAGFFSCGWNTSLETKQTLMPVSCLHRKKETWACWMDPLGGTWTRACLTICFRSSTNPLKRRDGVVCTFSCIWLIFLSSLWVILKSALL